MLNEADVQQLQIYTNLAQFGDSAPLRLGVDLVKLRQELQAFEKDWVPYNRYKPNIPRWGLSITSLDGGMTGWPDLESFKDVYDQTGKLHREAEFSEPTRAFRQLTSLHPLLNEFAPLGRSHFLHLKAGGFFPPHRDYDHSCFRIIVPCFGCATLSYHFMIEDRKIHLEPGVAHFVATRKVHSVMSFNDECMMLVLNVPSTLENFFRVRTNLRTK